MSEVMEDPIDEQTFFIWEGKDLNLRLARKALEVAQRDLVTAEQEEQKAWSDVEALRKRRDLVYERAQDE